MFTFSTLAGSQFHLMALQIVAQQYERVCTAKLLWACFMKREEEEDVRERKRENWRGIFAVLTNPFL